MTPTQQGRGDDTQSQGNADERAITAKAANKEATIHPGYALDSRDPNI